MNIISSRKCIYYGISGVRKISTLKKNDFFFKTDQTYERYLKKITQNGLISLFIWGGSATLAVLFFSQGIPRVRTQIHQQLPVFGPSFNEDIPSSDIPQ
ncbi:hypothetical protein T552_01931 [Pneumocystis carinii B80]|uniref:Uncharacterized protein n=1 Tax=Pneumocystis carinii (strain B80) TaxID=1408658 RepID=A0A0W4ZI89_PNEC8|nr:hypothetical protein T552_01931 [Pneumocystis carinii B80]KTW28069.1 hypothetical protein T552_01931 [Pneumocystis carinii B80]